MSEAQAIVEAGASKMFFACGLTQTLVGALRFGATILPSCIFAVVSIKIKP
jgi:hypothetical protein